ncbi:MAG: MASE3 domain-containing protein [Oscillochloridaceae bacterium umkhey_bin13]
MNAPSRPPDRGKLPTLSVVRWSFVPPNQTLIALTLLASLLSLGMIGVAVLGPARVQLSQGAYAGVQTLLELLAVLGALLIFSVGWTRAGPPRTRLTIVMAGGFLMVGMIDLLHTLSYLGMLDLVMPADPEKAIFFWLVARSITAITLLVLVLCSCHTQASQPMRLIVLGVSLSLITLTIWLGLWHADALLPRTSIPDEGLTPFKIGAELLIIALLIAAALALLLQRDQRGPVQPVDLLAALFTLIASEICFILYAEVTDGFNLLGHGYKVLAYLFLYRALLKSAIAEPYQQLLATRDQLAHEQAALYASEARLREREERLSLVLEGSNDGFWDWDIPSGAVIYSTRWATMLGYTPDELAPFISTWQRLVHPDDLPLLEATLQAHFSGQTERYQCEHRMLTKTGEWRWILDRGRVTTWDQDGNPLRMVGTHTDVHDRYQIEQDLRLRQSELLIANAQLQALATSDGLTGLANHRALQEKLAAAVELSRRSASPLALIMLDIDHFKRFNDTFGHPAGDHVLKVVSGVLRASVRLSDTVARYGGEEFAILMPETDLVGAFETAERCRHAINTLTWKDWTITASFGVAAWEPSCGLPQQLIAEADAALYAAKHAGRNRVVSQDQLAV